jgi:hypothetical protein
MNETFIVIEEGVRVLKGKKRRLQLNFVKYSFVSIHFLKYN